MQVFLILRAMLYIFNNYFIDIYFGNDKIMTEKISGPDACGMYCNVMERKVMKKSKGKKGNGGFSLVELIIVIAIMAVLVGVLAPQYLSYIHKAKVAADQANLKNYYTEIQLDYASTGVYNPQVTIYAIIVICAQLLMRMNRQSKSIWILVSLHFCDGG